MIKKEILSGATYVYSYREPPDALVNEALPLYGVQHDDQIHTVADYNALPDEKRVELIDGKFYEMTAPRPIHQAILTELMYHFEHFHRTNPDGRDCRVFPAPFDVQLDRDNYTMLEPDLSILCDRDKIRDFGCFGAPDLVVEILSLSTRTKDMYLKLQKYKSAGVREYWIIDPFRKYVIVYDFEHGDAVSLYGFEDRIPVGISGGAFTLDFAQIYEEIRYLL